MPPASMATARASDMLAVYSATTTAMMIATVGLGPDIIPLELPTSAPKTPTARIP